MKLSRGRRSESDELSVAFEGTLIHDRIKGVFEGTERHAIVDILLLGNY